jgi:predicted DCC family thiol-disulfide oxidoreductase YuxK
MSGEGPDSVNTEKFWLIWDGECGFCRRSVDWVRARDRDGIFRTLPYQEAPSPPMTPALHERSRRAVQVIMPDGSTLEAGMAAAFVLRKLGWKRLGRFMQWRPVAPLTEWGYRRVANNRGWLSRVLFGKASPEGG